MTFQNGLPDQLIAVNGTPVLIVESSHRDHGELISLCVGEVTTIAQLAKARDASFTPFEEAYDRLEDHLQDVRDDKIARLEPSLRSVLNRRPIEYQNNEERGRAENALYEIDRETSKTKAGKASDAIRNYLYWARDQGYQFPREVGNSESIPVGTQAVLIYRRNDPIALRKEIEGKIDRLKVEFQKPFVALLDRLEGIAQAAYIPQIEVLPQYRNKGLIRALLDIATWRIENGREPAGVTSARVIRERNYYDDRMIAIFKKAGYEELRIPREPGLFFGDTPAYSLMVRFNPKR